MNLRQLIAHRQTTQAAVARSLGWKPQTLTKYVSGERSPKYETAHAIADALSAVPVQPKTPDGEWTYRPVEDSQARKTTQEEANEGMSYLGYAE